ncbi:MAG TPA: peptidase M1 [Bacteroidetes bacterium]|nr:peptidase M1 [Bacteroidota bacterium]
MKRMLSFILCAALVQSLNAQESEEHAEGKFRLQELSRHSARAHLTKSLTPGQEGFDVTYYKLDLRLSTSPSPNSLSGSVTMAARSVVDNLSSITLDLMSSMTVDSVILGTTKLGFSQQTSSVTISLGRTIARGEVFSVRVFYRGLPGSSGFGSFAFSTTSGAPWVWTLSEPYGAKDWWPCKDHPTDKADSVDVWITCSASFKVGSQGKLIAVIDNGDGTRTHRWQHRFPISTYLVSIAVANYSEVSQWYRYSAVDSMIVLNYALPAQLATATSTLPLTIDMLRIFSDLYGLYPFVSEKYGHSQFGWLGGMEHQTMTSLGGFSEDLIAHELAHQWFGDMITCRTWPDIWLNEGFASYSVALYREKKYAPSSYWTVMNYEMSRARLAVGTIHVRDTSTTTRLFDGRLVYAKGATVLHMLRRVVGDSTFFRALKQYALDPRFKYKTASTGDLRSVFEAVSGKNLGYFFDEWIFGESYPRYRFEWGSRSNGAGFTVRITISQTPTTSNPAFFVMPIDFKLTGSGLDTTITLFNDTQNQAFAFNLSKQPTGVQLDPANWILKDAQGFMVNVEDQGRIPTEFSLGQNYPNPFNGSTVIPFELPQSSLIRLEAFDVLGKRVQTIVDDRVYGAGRHTIHFSASDAVGSSLTSGIYLYRMIVDGRPLLVRKMAYLR